ncbi:MAG: phage terminase large subunit [Parabacteroides sp.]|nr:phage terminase large subunit [Parabacteroides sp.]
MTDGERKHLVTESCRKRFYFFVQFFWSVIIQEKPVYNWHIKFLCDEMQELAHYIVNRLPKPYDLIINIPPGTTKSTITTIMFPVWLWTQDQSIRIITNSYSMDLSIEHATKSRDIIQSDKFQEYFPEIKLRPDKSAKMSYENTSTGARYATSTGGTITGKHAHVILNDDPLNVQQGYSELARITANEHTKTLSSRKVDKMNTPTITIMQRLHEQDVTGYLLSKKSDKIKHICLPAEVSKFVKPSFLVEKYIDGLLDPVRLSREVLDEAKIDLGSMSYSGQYDQNPIIDGGNIVKKEWFNTISIQDFEFLYKQNRNPAIHFFVDTAYTEKQINDPTGIIGAVEFSNNLYITSAAKARKEFPELVKFLPEWVKANRYDYRSTIRIEPKASGLSVIQQLKTSTKLNITNTPTPTDSKETRMQANSGVVESGRIYLVQGSWNDEFIDEVCGFPAKTHDEYVDLLNYAIDYFINDKTKPINVQQLLDDFR